MAYKNYVRSMKEAYDSMKVPIKLFSLLEGINVICNNIVSAKKKERVEVIVEYMLLVSVGEYLQV